VESETRRGCPIFAAPFAARVGPNHQINCPNPLSTNHLPRSNETRLDSSEKGTTESVVPFLRKNI
jgi:hypothetical protein